MKVGIYFPGYVPESGGSYSFEHDTLLSICELAQQTRHNLVLIFNNAPSDDVRTLMAEKGLKFIQLVRSPSLTSSQQLNLRIRRRLHLPIPPEPPHPFRAAVEQEKVELLWYSADTYKLVEIDVPYIATVFDIEHCMKPWFPEVSQSGTWQRREKYYISYLKRAAFLITPNQAGVDEISFCYNIPVERFRLLPYPSPLIDHVFSDDEIANVLDKYHLSKGYLFYPAQFWPHKNHVNLLLALKRLKEDFGLDKQLVLVGSDKGNKEFVRNFALTLGLEDQIHFLDFVPRDDLIALYYGAFALTYLSLFGPANLPPMEAFACGCPAIVSDIPGSRQQCEHAALMVNALDPDAIAAAIHELDIKPELRFALIERGHKSAGRYTWASYIRDVFKIFDEFEPIRRNWGSTYTRLG